MNTLLAIPLITIFLFLSSIHVYWGFGGKWGNGAVLPTKTDDEKVIMPGPIPTFIVAFGLLGFALVVLLNIIHIDFTEYFGLTFIHKYGLRVIAGIFLFRAIGEFHYVGFFKKHKHTKFAINDTKYYSPLCLTIGILAVLLELNKFGLF
ncbi:MAG: DUF3995 domain-containing protein [Leptospiraceae bacterium]|nr:DUF3995 domain-containing protein [Leptospiraceae bacterium]